MRMFLRDRRWAPAGLLASALLAAASSDGAVAGAAPGSGEVMLVNLQTNKCATIAGGVTTDNNHPSVQFDCDNDRSRRWRLNETTGWRYTRSGTFKPGSASTIAGGRSTDNNVPALQFNCDNDPSRTWRIIDVTGSGVHQLRNVQTNKCLTIAGGVSTDNNVPTLQFDCDNEPITPLDHSAETVRVDRHRAAGGPLEVLRREVLAIGVPRPGAMARDAGWPALLHGSHVPVSHAMASRDSC